MTTHSSRFSFDKAVWRDDRMLLGDVLFRIEHNRTAAWDAGDDHFRFYKVEGLIDAYRQVFERLQPSTRNILELGMWDGGSLVFWLETLHPEKCVGVDIEDRSDSAYFKRYRQTHDAAGRLATHWNTSQADARRLRQIVESEFQGPLDVVFDDASHLYEPTKRSFETLFPLLRPGGLYIVEDWAWDYWSHVLPRPEWGNQRSPAPLVFELAEAAGTARGAVASVSFFSTFVVIERGAVNLGSDFSLDDQIFRRPKPTLQRRILNRVLWGPERDALAKLKKVVSRKSRRRSGP